MLDFEGITMPRNLIVIPSYNYNITGRAKWRLRVAASVNHINVPISIEIQYKGNDPHAPR
jgi:hypothetical protein